MRADTLDQLTRNPGNATEEHVAWLIAEVRRLRSAVDESQARAMLDVERLEQLELVADKALALHRELAGETMGIITPGFRDLGQALKELRELD